MEAKPKKRMSMRTIGKKSTAEMTTKEYAYAFKKQRLRLDDAFSKFIRARDGRCVICGSTEALQCSHVFTKNAHGAVRWDEMNAHAMCAKCHTIHHRTDPGIYIEWMIEHYGDAYNDLRRRANAYKKWDIDEMKELEKSFARRTPNE